MSVNTLAPPIAPRYAKKMLKIIALAPLFLALTACPSPKPRLTPDGIPVRDAYTIERDNALVDFKYGFSREVAGIHALSIRFSREGWQLLEELERMAADGKAAAQENGYRYNRYFHVTDISTAGSSTELLSLRQSTGYYTGGAHPNSFTKAHYWDRVGIRTIESGDLFIGDALEGLLADRFCPKLNEERLARRGEMFGDGIFDECPTAQSLSVIAVDADENRAFERFDVVADPYVAGPYAEGRYEIELPVDEDMLAMLKPAYRGSFEVAGQ